jgi:S-adenosylmethionine decarboxylase
LAGAPRQLGQEWLVDASGCRPEALRDPRVLAGIVESLVVSLKLKVVGTPQWHTFPGPGGITGLALLSESHLGIHTFPEHGFAALSVYSCRTREAPDFESLLRAALGATAVSLRSVPREVAK